MVKTRMEIEGIPMVVWGEEAVRVFIAVHGNQSNKEDIVIQMLAEEAVRQGYQVISFDLPEHGERRNDSTPCKVQNCVRDLRTIFDYAAECWSEISLFACSMGAYFSLLEYQDELLGQTLFLSPVVDMGRIIDNMMRWFQVSPNQLEKETEIKTPMGQSLYWDYYCYVKNHPIEKWNSPTSILYGDKDELCERDTIELFVRRFHCQIKILDSGEHYFHTQEQLDEFAVWLKRKIVK